MLKTEAVKTFLLSTGNLHLTSLYNEDMEVQVNVAKDNGYKTGGTWLGKKWKGWTDGTTVWKSFRIPFSADYNPNYTDTELKFNLASHAEAIGMTGWDWKNKKSRWVGFDFDSIVNHKQAGLEESELEEIKNLVSDIPWVTLLKSTSGEGLHIYIHLEPVATETHTEHAALARAILSLLSAEVGCNLNNSVDICGGILWVYHRKQQGTEGFSLLKEGNLLPTSLIPKNWKDHLEVTSRKRPKVKRKKDAEKFESLFASVSEIKLEDHHKKLLKWFCVSDKEGKLFGDWWWDSDYNMLVCHTLDLVKAHKDLNMIGFFHTSSSGSSEQNCFCFPSLGGGWVVRRHGIGTKEHLSWSVDPTGWTRCTLNEKPDIEACAKVNKGIESAKGEFVFPDCKSGLAALENYGVTELNIPEAVSWSKRKFYIKHKSDDKLLVSLDAFDQDDEEAMGDCGFLKVKKRWESVIYHHKPDKEVQAPDYLIRHLVSKDSEAGWFIRINNSWISHSKSNVSTVLTSQMSNKDIDQAMGKALLNPWFLVNKPFEPEYIGGRQWNREAASFSVQPEEGTYDTWLSVLEHCGSSLDAYVEKDSWCLDNGVETGSDYLAYWIANMFQRPNEPLPYLFFVGEENTGKSTLHEGLKTLFKKGKGYVRADQALTSKGNFNGELEGAVLCVVEETNLTQNKEANNRLKDWVTGKTISIRPMYVSPFDIDNTTHWIQCANDASYCTVMPGDTRIVVIHVNAIESEIPKILFLKKLEDERAAFLNYILNIDLPAPAGRLAIPCLSTSDKEELESYNSSSLERFMKESVFVRKGNLVYFDDFYQAFQDWLPGEERHNWTVARVSREYPKSKPYCKGRYGDLNRTALGNISFNKDDEDLESDFTFNPSNKRIVRKEI